MAASRHTLVTSAPQEASGRALRPRVFFLPCFCPGVGGFQGPKMGANRLDRLLDLESPSDPSSDGVTLFSSFRGIQVTQMHQESHPLPFELGPRSSKWPKLRFQRT